MNIKIKHLFKTQLKILVIEIAITILSFFIMHFTVLYMPMRANLLYITLDSLILPGEFIGADLQLITKNIYVFMIGGLIGNHLIYNIYYHFCKKYKVCVYLACIIYLYWAINYIIIKVTF